MTRWRPDLLDGFEQRPVSAEPGAAVVVRGPAPDRPRGIAVLAVHGFNDYVFQAHHAAEWTARGYAFHGVDLRRCGRALRPDEPANYCTDLAEWAADLSAAARLVLAGGGDRPRPERLVVLAHSTGGLVASLWAHSLRRAGVLDALVLNSPWFDLNARWFRRVVASRWVDAIGPVDPLRVVANGASAYSYHLHVAHGGRWEYDLRLKPPGGFPVRMGWLRAVRRGQARVARGLDIAAPVLVCTAAASGPNRLDNPDLDRQDTVVDVRHIWARAPGLGQDVTIERIPGGIHDLSLSADEPRARYTRTLFAWLEHALA